MTYLLVSVSLFVAGFVKGVFGMGLPAVSLGLLSLIMTPVAAASLIVAPTLATNAWQFFTGADRRLLVRRLSALLIAVCIGTALGIGFLTGVSAPRVSLALGVVLILYAIAGMLAPEFSIARSHERWMSPVIGVATGLVNGATGVSVMPLVPYLNSIGLARDTLIQAMGLVFMIAVIALATCLAWTGHFRSAVAAQSLLAMLPVFAGMYAGQRLRRRMRAQEFRRWFFVGLVALGSYSVLRAVWQLAAEVRHPY